MSDQDQALRVVRHPLVEHHLARLRDVTTSPADFRVQVDRIATLLVSAATENLATREQTVETPLTTTTAQVLAERVAIVPILRAGIGIVEPLLRLIPEAEVWHLGLYRDEETTRPVEYYRKLPKTEPVDVAFIVDPMLATGGSATLALDVLREWGVPRTTLVSVIAAPEGIQAVHEKFPDTQIVTAAVDERLNENKFIVPGLGDAGDRLFNTLR